MTDIAIEKLNKSFGPHHVLRDIDLQIPAGGFVVLLGPSGCGKSTLLSAIAGLDEIDRGRILVGDTDVTHVDPSRRGMAMVFQSYALYPTMTVARNMSFGLRVAGMPRAEVERRVDWAADLLQIRELLHRKPSQLSGGQRQRVAIGRALVRRGAIFLFDEPLSNLDAKLRNEMRLEIKRLHRELGSTIVYVTHDQVEAMTLATRVAVMRAGRVEQYAEPETLYAKPATLFVAGFVGSPAMNLLPGRLHRRDGAYAAEVEERLLPLAGYEFLGEPEDGEEIMLGVRPEDIAVGEGAPGAVPAEARLGILEPLGADTLAWCEIGRQRLCVRLPPDRARALDETVPLRLDMSKASIFSARTELRL